MGLLDMVQYLKSIGLALLLSVGIGSVGKAANCSNDPNECTPKKLCEQSTVLKDGNTIWSTDPTTSRYVSFAQSFGMTCGVITIIDPCDIDPAQCKISQLCEKATTQTLGYTVWNEAARGYVLVAKEYELSCGIKTETSGSLTDNRPTAKPITLFGVNFDTSKDEVEEAIAKRFSCRWVSMGGSLRVCSTDGGTLLRMSFNNLGEIDTLYFHCETYKGCTFSFDEAFGTLLKSNNLQPHNIELEDGKCGVGDLGDLVCVFESHIILSRNKFGIGALSFD